jgi:hypothetical protein
LSYCQEVDVVTMRHHQPGPPDPENDPTGVRALLSSLPDPGPMPEHLVARIQASIAAEQAARARVVALTPRRRPLWRTAGLAAAAAAVVAVGGASLLTGTAPGDLGAALFGGGLTASSAEDSSGGQAKSGSADSGTPDASGRESGPSTSSAQTSQPASAAGAVRVLHTNAAYTRDGLQAQAARLLVLPGEPMGPNAAESPAIGTIGTEQGVRSCLSAVTGQPLGQLPGEVTADLGTFDGVPAAVLVLTTGAGHTAYAVQRMCTLGNPAVLAGPIALP